MGISLFQGDCLDVMRGMESNSIDSIVTDPPYGLSFMGKKWDYEVPSVAIWEEALRILKPGGFLLSFSGTRTYHRMVVNIEDAGFEIRDQLGWLYGSGMPKTMDLDKAVQKIDPTNSEWKGWGTALKPAFEPICMARKPFSGTLTRNVIEHGVGGLNIDDTRIPGDNPSIARRESARKSGNAPGRPTEYTHTINDRTSPDVYMKDREAELLGRYPANIIHDGSDEVIDVLPDVARFFYHAKASKADREGSTHPTVKPVAVMAYLIKLVTPKGGRVLDPFAGSGTTGMAAIQSGFNGVLIEMDADYYAFLEDRFFIFQDR